jgi:Mn-dependent DtxR family transcriptional regulator
MAQSALARPTDLGDVIFDLLKRRGPLCASQMAVELGVSLKHLDPALKNLQAEGSIELRPDRDRALPHDEAETPWGLPVPWSRKT